jgi:tetratricopeptide (TPR) repeat protein
VLLVLALVLSASAYAQLTAETAPDLYKLASQQFADRKFDQAKTSFERAIQLDGTSSEAYRGLGLADLALNDYQGAYQAWLKAADLNPKDEKSRYCLGRLFYDANLVNEAAAWLRKALELDSNDFEAMTYLGLSAEALGFDETAVQLYNKAVLISKSKHQPYSWAFLSLANYLRKHGEQGKALKILEEGSQTCPEAHELAALGEMLADEGQTARAESILRQAIALDSGVSQAHYRLALLLKSAGRSQEAAAEMEKFRETKAQQDKLPKIMALRKSEATVR